MQDDELLDFFKELSTYLRDNKSARDDILSNMSEETLTMFKNYCDNIRIMETREYIHDLMNLSKKDREEIINGFPDKVYKRIYEDSLVCLFNALASLPKDKRESFYPYLTDIEKETLELYVKSLKDDDYGSNGDGSLRLSPPKVLRPYKTLQERLGRALTESLMQQVKFLKEMTRERQLARYDEIIEEAERMQKDVGELGNNLEEGFSRVRGHHSGH